MGREDYTPIHHSERRHVSRSQTITPRRISLTTSASITSTDGKIQLTVCSVSIGAINFMTRRRTLVSRVRHCITSRFFQCRIRFRRTVLQATVPSSCPLSNPFARISFDFSSLARQLTETARQSSATCSEVILRTTGGVIRRHSQTVPTPNRAILRPNFFV